MTAALVVLPLGISSCSGGSASSPSATTSNAMVSFTLPRTTDVGTTQVLNGSVSGDATSNSPPGYDFVPITNSTVAGSITLANITYSYTAPASVPIYTASNLAAGAVNGQVTIRAYRATNAFGQPSTYATASATTIILGPVVTGISPATVSIARNGTQQFSGYALGSLNTQVVWLVNSVAGGSTATGSISASGLYTAPVAIPMNGAAVTITVQSAAEPAKSSSAIVTIT